MKKRLFILSTSCILLSSAFLPSTVVAFTPDAENNYISPLTLKKQIDDYHEQEAKRIVDLQLNVVPSFDANLVIETSKRYIGTNYKISGKTPSGFDCSGFVSYVFKKSSNISLTGSSADFYQCGTSIKIENLQSGDLVFFNTNGKSISHVGIYIGEGRFIHSSSNGVTISSLSESYYESRYVGAKRL